MGKNLCAELTRIGVDQELAAKVSASLDPEYNASKKDILVMQEAIMQVQLHSDNRHHEQNRRIDTSYHELNNKIDSRYHELDSKIDQGFASIRTDMASMTRQYLITFGTLLCSILAVILVNVWFHL